MTKEAVIQKLTEVHEDICLMSEYQCGIWKKQHESKEVEDLRQEYGIEAPLLMALFYGVVAVQGFYRLPHCEISDGLEQTKKLFKAAILRMKGGYLEKQIISNETD